MLARTPLAFLTLACALALGCDGGARAPRGYTACGDFPSGPVECQPGQWCVDATFSECTPGCTSDLNCADGQTCMKAPGQSVGDCQNATTPPPSGDAGTPAPPAQGFTACGDFGGDPVQCQPGQYCVDPTFSDCRPGCTSDVSCASNQSCVKDAGESVGDCRNDGPGPGPGPSDNVFECEHACRNASLFCEDGSVSAGDVGACEVWCNDAGTTEAERTAFIGCIDAALFTTPICDQADCLP